MALKKMKIGDFEVQINPETVKHTRSIVYADDEVVGANLPTKQFKYYGPEKISFSLVFDGTGVVPGSEGSGTPDDINDQIAKFEKEVFNFDGGKHGPKKVAIKWGSLVIDQCLIKTYDINYKLFAPSGSPIRAEISLEFEGTVDRKTRAKKANTNSPDLTHIKTVRRGDVLYLMANDVYESPRYYLQVAAVNNILNFRKLQEGQQLLFPPLER